MHWPLENPLVCADSNVESNQVPKRAPPTKLDAIKNIEDLSIYFEITPLKRSFSSGILLVAYTRLRFSDVQRLRILEIIEDSIRGTLLQSATKQPHCLPRPWACPRMGASGSTEWVAPLIEFHVAREKLNGSLPSFVSPCLNHRWELEKAEPAAYPPTRWKLAPVCAGLNGPGGETHTLHSPKNFLPTAATQVNFETRELNAIGRWPINSRMNERYDRSVRSGELLLRNAIIQKMAPWRNMVDSFRLPESAQGSERIGKEPTERSTNVVDLEYAPATQLVGNTSRETTSTVPNELEDSSLGLGGESPTAEIPAVPP